MKAKGILVAATAALLMLAGPARAATGVAGHWSFDEGSGATVADDSGFADAGSVLGGATWVAGKRGPWALSFDGSTGSVDVPSAAQLEPTTVTAQAWVKSQGTPGSWKYILGKGAGGCNAATYALYTGHDGGLEFYVSNNGGVSYTLSPDAGTGVWDGAWHRVTGTFDGSTVRLYVDGTEVGSGTPRSAPMDYNLGARDLLVGNYGACAGGGNFDFGGAVDEPKVYGRALSAAEVAADGAYPFQGFFQPVDNEPVENVVKAGSAVPVKFSLGANYGLGILTVGSPFSGAINCSSTAPLDDIEQTVTAGASSLQYDAVSNQYTYVWKTDKSWAPTCRRLSVQLNDGSVHTALFSFK